MPAQWASWLGSCPDATLSIAAAAVAAEQQARALRAADPEVLAHAAFGEAFTVQGVAAAPWVTGQGLLVAPGFRRDRSAAAHTCAFVQVDQQWVWESPHLAADVLRRGGVRGRDLLCTVSVVPAYDGMRVDRLASNAVRGLHRLTRCDSWVVSGARLQPVPGRVRSAAAHPGRDTG